MVNNNVQIDGKNAILGRIDSLRLRRQTSLLRTTPHRRMPMPLATTGDHLNPDLAVHLIHFNLHFDVHKMLLNVFMLSMPSWAFLGLYQVRSLAGGSGPMISDDRRYSIKMSLSFNIAYQSA